MQHRKGLKKAYKKATGQSLSQKDGATLANLCVIGCSRKPWPLQLWSHSQNNRSLSSTLQAEQDNGHPLPAFSNLQIEVLDENNQTPYFLEMNYHGYVNEASPVGTTILTNASLSAPLVIIALDNDVEEVSSPAVS